MDNNQVRSHAGMPPTPQVPSPKGTAHSGESAQEVSDAEGFDLVLAEQMAAECAIGCDYPEGPLSPEGARW